MATSQEYIDFVAEQIAPFGAVTARKMFGEYVLYLNGKGILTVCDNAVFVKKYPELEALMQGASCGAPDRRSGPAVTAGRIARRASSNT